jgi:hypothetical protein
MDYKLYRCYFHSMTEEKTTTKPIEPYNGTMHAGLFLKRYLSNEHQYQLIFPIKLICKRDQTKKIIDYDWARHDNAIV